MKRLLTIFLLTMCNAMLFAQDTEKTMDQKINDAIGPYTDAISGFIFSSFSVNVGGVPIAVPFVLIWLLAGAIFFTIYNGFFNIRGFPLALNVVRGVFTNPNDKGQVSHFQALTTALSATVGLGNIAGVAIAIAVGGPGATFWMIVAGLLGMSSKFVECTLGVKYRDIDADGTVHGGPMHYLSKGLGNWGPNWGRSGKVLAVIFAICCIGGSFGGGNMFQVNQAYQQTAAIFGLEGFGVWYGIIMAICVWIVIIGGINSIAKTTEKIVPLMCGIYVISALIIIVMNYDKIISTFGLIFSEAFNPTAVAGGFIGVLIQGFRRAAFSNEAGIGSAAIAHSAVKTNEHVSEGVVALLEPFIDTVVICTMTALVIIITGAYTDANATDGIALTAQAFTSKLAWFNIFLWIAVTLFAFSTMISWSYYGLQAWTYLFGKSKLADRSYKYLFLVFVVIGAAANLQKVVDFSDAMIFAMCFPNVIGLVLLAPEVKRDLASYLSRIKSGALPRYK